MFNLSFLQLVLHQAESLTDLTGFIRQNLSQVSQYCRSGDIHEVLIFASFARRTNARILESHENYLYNGATKKKRKFANSKLREKSQNQKLANI